MSMGLPENTKTAAVALVLLAAVPAILLAGCGLGEDDYTPPKPPENVGYPYDEARIGPDGIAEVPALSKGQKEEGLYISQNDPHVVALLKGHPAEWRKNVASWTRTNQELLGAVYTVRFDQPVDFKDAKWPTIENTGELYGKQGPEGVVIGEVEPRVEPKVGIRTASEENVRALMIMVDLESGQVASVAPAPF